MSDGDTVEVPAEVVSNDKKTKAKDGEVIKNKDILDRTEAEGNYILKMTADQRQAYDTEVQTVKDRIRDAGKKNLEARWHSGRLAAKLVTDAKKGGSTYGNATCKGLARDLGMGYSTLRKCMNMAKEFTLAEIKKTPLTVDAIDLLLKENPEVQQKVIKRLGESIDKEADYRPTTDQIGDVIKEEVSSFEESKDGQANAARDDKPARANNFGTNSATGKNHKQVLARLIKALENVEGAAANAVITEREFQDDPDVSDKGMEAITEMLGESKTAADNVLSTLKSIVATFGKRKREIEKVTAANKKAEAAAAKKKTAKK